MENLELYNKVRTVPPEAQKKITGGRLNGMTDINPMWRIKALTEQFGICGIGWKYEITKQWLNEGGNGEISAFCNINLYIKVDNGWSDAIPGTGGSSFVANEKSGVHLSDECFKMALTDAISVACKALGFGADVYWSGDRSKYDAIPQEQVQKIDEITLKTLESLIYESKSDVDKILQLYKVKSLSDLTTTQSGQLKHQLNVKLNKKGA